MNITLTPDVFNAMFEFGAACFQLMNIRAVWRDKGYAGVAVTPVIVFTIWGLWNLFYYPHLEQWWSLGGGLCITVVNTIWIGLMLYFGKKSYV